MTKAETWNDKPAASFWRSFPIFAHLGDEALESVSRLCVRRMFRDGESLFKKGDPGKQLYALAEGRIRLSNISQNGREMLIRFAEPGDLVGEIACLDGGDRSSDAVAETAVVTFVLTNIQFQSVAKTHPELYQASIKHLADLVRATNDRLESVSLYELRSRLARFLVFSLGQKHGAALEQTEYLDLNFTQSELAQLVGASRPKLNIVLQEFRDADVIVKEGSVWRCNVVALRALSEI